MNGLNVEGEWVEDPKRVIEEVKNFFEQRFQDENERCCSLDGVAFERITFEESCGLKSFFEEREKRCGVLVVTKAQAGLQLQIHQDFLGFDEGGCYDIFDKIPC